MENKTVVSIETVIDYIEANLDGKLDLETVAEAVHYSKYHLHRMFTSTVGMTIHDYVQRRQLTEAAKLLAFSDRPIIEVTFATVYKGNIIKNLIMDCQSYTKYRPNETTGGIFVSWRRKEELPTGA